MFKLLIECSKDITALKIDFADGTSTVQTSTSAQPTQPTQAPRVKKSTDDGSASAEVQNTRGKKEVFLDTDADYSTISQEVVQLPKIDIPDRPVSVAPELQNLDF